MKVFNPDSVDVKEVVLVVPNKEMKQFIEALELAVKTNKRKKSWGKLLNQLSKEAGCY